MITFIAKKVARPAIIITLIFTALLAWPVFTRAGNPPQPQEEVYYFLTDHLGSIDVVLDEEGNVVERADYLPYGNDRLRIDDSESEDNDYGFTGKEADDETGLYYYGARYYDPEIGRFTQIDPLVLGESEKPLADVLSNPQALNGYSYVLNNPMRYVDENGEYGCDVHCDLTQYLALKSGLDVTTASEIAIYDNRMDTDPQTDPHNPENLINGNTDKYHFQNRSVAEAWLFAAIAKKDTRAFGQALHTYQDSYSHNGLNWITHAALTIQEGADGEFGTDPDKTNNNVLKATFMSFNTFSFMRGLQKYKLGIVDEKEITKYDEDTKNIWGSISGNVDEFLKAEDKTSTNIYKEIHANDKDEKK